jgi:serine acetyltransferase
MENISRFIALSDHWLARFGRRIYCKVLSFSVPTPRLIAWSFLQVVLTLRSVYYFIARTLFCEPFFKAYCTEYGKNLHTGVYLHWVKGPGKIIVGDNVTVDGKCSFLFALRYSDAPTLMLGDGTGIGHNCSFTIGKQITIGRHCRIASGVSMFDTPGHPSDPEARLAGLPARTEEVVPISIGNNVWIGSRSIIYPGVTVGDGSVVAMGSVVMSNVAPNVLVAGNPARQVRSLARVTVSS